MKTMQRLLQFVILTCALLMMCVGVSAKTNSMIDQAHILTANQRSELARTLDQIEKKHDVRIAVITVNKIKGNDMAKYSNFVLDKNFTEGKNGNMLLLIDMQKKNWHISTDKKMEKMLPNTTAIQAIKNNMLPHLKKSEFAKAFTKYAVTSDQMITYYKENGRPYGSKAAPAKKEEKKGFSFAALLGALFFGGIGANVYGGSLKKSMSNVAEATEADDYLQQETFQLTEKEDSFLYITVSAVPKGSHRTADDDTDHGDDYHGGDGGSFGDEDSDYDIFDTDSDDGGDFDDSDFDSGDDD